MKQIPCIILLLFISVGCDNDEPVQVEPQWKKLGLNGYTINELELRGDAIYAATDGGLYFKKINENTDFTLLGLPDLNIEDVVVLSESEILVSVVDRSFQEPPALYETQNGGQTWEEIEHNFGGDSGGEPVFDLAVSEGTSPVLYGSGFAVVARSSDQGRTWQPIWGDWGGFATGVSTVEICPQTNAVWAGGQGAIENGFLLYSADESEWTSWTDLVPNPTVVKEIAFEDADRLFVGFEGALLRTSDKGNTWKTVIESDDNRFFFGIALRRDNPDHVFAGGWLKTPDAQPLLLYHTSDGGNAWKTFSYSSEEFGGIYDMVSISEAGRERIFLGLYKGGIYEVVVPME